MSKGCRSCIATRSTGCWWRRRWRRRRSSIPRTPSLRPIPSWCASCEGPAARPLHRMQPLLPGLSRDLDEIAVLGFGHAGGRVAEEHVHRLELAALEAEPLHVAEDVAGFGPAGIEHERGAAPRHHRLEGEGLDRAAVRPAAGEIAVAADAVVIGA